LAEKLLHDRSDKISQLTLIPSGGGVHEVMFGDVLVHSKKETGEHPKPEQVLAAI
jgi:selT/selW/selH-like putative selenoprotein